MAKDHKDIINRFSTVRDNRQTKSSEQDFMHDLIDSIRPVPPIVDEQYLMRLLKVSDFLGISDDILSQEICAPEPFVFVKNTIFIPKIYRLSLDIKLRINKYLKRLSEIKNLQSPRMSPLIMETKEETPTSRINDIAGANGNNSTADQNQKMRPAYSPPKSSDIDIKSVIKFLKEGNSLIKETISNEIRNSFSRSWVEFNIK